MMPRRQSYSAIVSALALSIAAASPQIAIASGLENIYTEKFDGRVSGDLRIDETGVYQFATARPGNANVFIDGALIVNGANGEFVGAIALGAGNYEVAIEPLAGAANLTLGFPGLDRRVTLYNGSSAAPEAMSSSMTGSSMPSQMSMSGGASASRVASASSVTASALPDDVRVRAPREGAGRSLRGRLRGQLRERAIERAIDRGEIARATVNGETSDYVRVGRTVEVTASPPPGMEFDRWGGDVFMLSDPNAQTTTLNIIAGGANVFAVFREIGSDSSTPTPGNNNSGNNNNGGGNTGGNNPGGSNPGGNNNNSGGDVPPRNPNVDNSNGDDAPSVVTPPSDQPTALDPDAPVVTPPDSGPDPEAERFDVAIANGVGDGRYEAGSRVVIRADNPPAGQSFAGWQGDVAALADPNAPATILTVPDGGASVSASYADTDLSVTLFSSGVVASPKGATIAGVVRNSNATSIEYDVIGPNGSAIATGLQAPVNPSSGRFAARIFEENLPASGFVTVVARASGAGDQPTGVTSFQVSQSPDPIVQLVARTSFGATPASMARARQIGYDAFLEEQLNPLTIDDTDFRALNPDALFDVSQNHVPRELFRLSLAYAFYSKRQLQEVMAMFWENHFYTVPWNDGAHQAELDEKNAFRANAFGKFRDILEISAKSPVMMSYLDNKNSRVGNINENYARELLELHTVGVNSSYTEDDLIEVAKILTGWSLELTNPNRPDGHGKTHRFIFEPSRHDTSDKTVSFLNHTFTGRSGAAGVQEGEELLDMLAAHPDTAAYICFKLAQLFVADAPPSGLVDRCASTFLSTEGDMKQIVRLILSSSEFKSSAENYHAKFRNPFEHTASTIRAFDMFPQSGRFVEAMHGITSHIDAAGYRLYNAAPPTGLPEVGSAWSGASSVVSRTAFEIRAVREVGGFMQFDQRAIFDASPADTAEGVAALICGRTMHNRCTRAEFEEMTAAIYGDDDLFDPASENIDFAVIRALQVAVATTSFALH